MFVVFIYLFVGYNQSVIGKIFNKRYFLALVKKEIFYVLFVVLIKCCFLYKNIFIFKRYLQSTPLFKKKYKLLSVCVRVIGGNRNRNPQIDGSAHCRLVYRGTQNRSTVQVAILKIFCSKLSYKFIVAEAYYYWLKSSHYFTYTNVLRKQHFIRS